MNWRYRNPGPTGRWFTSVRTNESAVSDMALTNATVAMKVLTGSWNNATSSAAPKIAVAKAMRPTYIQRRSRRGSSTARYRSSSPSGITGRIGSWYCITQ
jgi:hypothetical protein